MDGEDRGLIIILEEDKEDQYLMKMELAGSPLVDSILFITRFDELFNHLHDLRRRGGLIRAGAVYRPKLILINSFLPSGELVKIAGEIQAVFGKGFPIVIMAASQNEKEYIEETVHPDVMGYLIKPVTVDKLENLIATIH